MRLCALALAACACAPPPANASSARVLAIVGATVIPMTGREGSLADHTVVVEGASIRWIGPAGRPSCPPARRWWTGAAASFSLAWSIPTSTCATRASCARIWPTA